MIFFSLLVVVCWLVSFLITNPIAIDERVKETAQDSGNKKVMNKLGCHPGEKGHRSKRFTVILGFYRFFV